MLSFTSLTAIPQMASINAMAVCIPSNKVFSGPLGGVINKLTGAFGGLIPLIVLVGIVLLALTGTYYAMRQRDVSIIYRSMVALVSVPFVAIALLVVWTGVYATFNHLCK